MIRSDHTCPHCGYVMRDMIAPTVCDRCARPMAAPALAKGDRVIIRPASYPLQVWRGVIAFRTKTGFSVDYEAHGMQWRAVFTPRELSAATSGGSQ